MTMSVDQMKLELEEKIQEQIHESNEQLNVMAVAPNVLSTIHSHVSDLLSSTVGASAPKHSVGAGAPTAGLGDSPYNPFNGGGYADQIAMDIDNIYRNPNDPNAIQTLMNDLGKLTPTQLNDSSVQKLLAQFNVSGNLSSMVTEMVEYSYFMGGGTSGSQAYINSMIAQLGNPPNNPLAAQMAGLLQGWSQGGAQMNQFDHDHNSNGCLIWTIPNPTGDGMLQLQWPGDSFSILQLIGNQSVGTNTNPYISGLQPDPQTWISNFLSQYRSDAMNQLWASTHNLGLMVMYLMMLFDGDSQSQQGGLSNTTNLLSDMTDKFANSLVSTGQSIGTWSVVGGQASKFLYLLLTSGVVMNSESQFGGSGGAASDWTSNVLSPIVNQQVTLPNGTVTTIGSLMSAYLNSSGSYQSLKDLTDGFNSLNSGSNAGPQPGYQAIINALQSGSGLLTGQSKTVSTQLSLATNQDAQLIKFGSSNAASDGGGWNQMLLALINNQVSH
jgi:hypothetical protein